MFQQIQPISDLRLPPPEGSIQRGYAALGCAPVGSAYPRFAVDKATLRLRLTLLVILVDISAVYCGVLGVALLAINGARGSSNGELPGLIAASYFLTAFNTKAYGFAALEDFGCGIRRSLAALAITFGTGILFIYKLDLANQFSRLELAASAAVCAVLLIFGRAAVNRLVQELMPDGLTNKLVLCDGTMRLPRRGEIVIQTGDYGVYPTTDDPVVMDRLGHLARDADRIVISCPLERREAWGKALKGLGIDTEILMPELDPIGALNLQHFDGVTTALVTRGPLCLRDRALKRSFDLAIIALFLVPALLIGSVCALLIKLSDGGPVFFIQNRFGQGNRLFRLYKFRTMRCEMLDIDGRRSTSRADPRITRIGAFLRATSLDELPQFLNILRGDMSIVGPRPHAIRSTAGNSLFWEIDSRYWDRHAAKPGLTGLAQIRGYRGATAERGDLTNRLQADLEYLSHWSLHRDLRIVIATFGVLLHKNAY